MDNQRSSKAVGILPWNMRMVPICARLCNLSSINAAQKIFSKTYHEIICDTLVRREGALSNAYGAIHMGGVPLEQTMPVQASRLIAELVVNMYNELITDRDMDLWNRPLTIDAHDRAVLLIIRISRYPCDIEIVGDGRSLGKQAGSS